MKMKYVLSVSSFIKKKKKSHEKVDYTLILI